MDKRTYYTNRPQHVVLEDILLAAAGNRIRCIQVRPQSLRGNHEVDEYLVRNTKRKR